VAEHKSSNDGYRGLMDVLAVVGQLAFVAISVFAGVVTVVALLAITVALILSI
jgi:hypothetical protein